MGYINKKNKVGAVAENAAPYLQEGELGIDLNAANGDVGRVYVGTGSQNVALAKKTEVDLLNTLKAPLESPALTGIPTAPTAVVGTDTTQVATTEYVKAEIASESYSKVELDAGQLDNRYYTETEIDTKLAGVVSSTVDLDSNQTIAGVKTFSSSPIVPTATAANQAVNKAYVDNLKTITSGTATFNSATNNINLTGIGIGIEIGDVIQISGATDSKNNSEFTVEVITDNNNIIVNQAHANKGTSKNVANRSVDDNVTVKLLAKWYNASIGLGQGWVEVTSSRSFEVSYPNTTNRTITVSVSAEFINTPTASLSIDGVTVSRIEITSGFDSTLTGEVPIDGNYIVSKEGGGTLTMKRWSELR